MISQKDFLLKLLPGFLPLLIYILAEYILGEKTALIFAIIFGISEFIFVFIKEKKADKFILLDTSLLVVMGAISFTMNNDIFFKLKPATIELLFLILIGISIFTPQDIIQQMMKRYVKNTDIFNQEAKKFKKSLLVMFFIFLFHILLIVYSAFYMSKESWAFISGGFLFIIFGFYFAIQLIVNKLKKREKYSVVDNNQNIIGSSYKILPSNNYIRIRAIVTYNKKLVVTERNNKLDIIVDTILPYNQNEEKFIETISNSINKKYFMKIMEYKTGNFFSKLYHIELSNLKNLKNIKFNLVEKNESQLNELLKEELKHIKI